MRTLIVSQAPSRSSDNALPFGGKLGARLASLSGLAGRPLSDAFDLRNLLDEWPGLGSGDVFHVARAASSFEVLLESASNERIVLVGEVAEAASRALGTNALEVLRWSRARDRMLIAVPHPSGVSKWWDDPANEASMRAFMVSESARSLRAAGLEHPDPAARETAELRAAIDAADASIVEVLASRLRAAERIQALRREAGGSRIDPVRESEIAASRPPELAAVIGAVLEVCRGRI